MNLKRYMVRKSVDQIQAECSANPLKRTLGPWGLVSLGIGCIIGAGIFVLTGKAAAQYAGPAIMLSFILAGMACAFAALCYAELASTLPVSGSAYTYAYATLGEMMAWIMGWLLILEYGLSAATVAVGWSGYVNSFLMNMGVFLPPELVNPNGKEIMVNVVSEAAKAMYISHGYMIGEAGQLLKDGVAVLGQFNLPAFLGVMMMTALLVVGISESAKVNNVVVAIKLVVVVTFIAVGAMYVDPANWHPFVPEQIMDTSGDHPISRYGYDGVLRAAGVIFFAYVGFESVSTAAQEAKNPQKDLPIGIIGSLVICTVLYIAMAAVLTGIVSYKNLNVPDPIAVAVDAIGLGWLSFVVKVGAIMGLTSVMMVLLYGQTRVFYMMSKDGLLPDTFSKVHPKFQTPYINTILVGIVTGLAAALTPIDVLGDLVSMGTLVAFSIVCFSVLWLRRTHPELTRPFKTPLMPFTPILGILFCGYLIYGIGWQVFITLHWYFIGGVVLYFSYSQFKSKLGKEFKGKKA